MEPFFSVIVPVYNVESYLRECVDSILTQTFSEFELILVNDGSVDGSPAICDEYARLDSRVTVIHKKNGGHTSARNAGIDAAIGEYVCYVDSDDYVEPCWLQTIYDDIIENGCPDMLAYNYFFNDRDGQHTLKNKIAPGYYDKTAMAEDIYPYMLYDRRNKTFENASLDWNIWTKPGKRDLYASHKVLDERITIGEDAVLIFNMLCAVDSIFISEKALYHYRIRSDSIMTSVTVGKHLSSLMLVYGRLKNDLAIYSQPLAMSLDCWYAKRLIHIARQVCRQNGLIASSVVLRRALKESGYIKRLRICSMPKKTRLLISPLKLKLPIVTVLMLKIINTVYR